MIHLSLGPSVHASIRSLLQSTWDPPIHPLLGPSVLADTPPRVHHPSGLSLLTSTSPSDVICNSPSPPLVDIVLFRLSLKVFKMCLLGREFHTLIKNALFSFSTDARSHNSPPLWGPVFSLALVPFSNRCGTPIHLPLGPNDLAGTLPHVHPLFRAQPSRWHITRCLALIPFVPAQSHR